MNDPEARYERLRRECPGGYDEWACRDKPCNGQYNCWGRCEGRGWLPLPEPERTGALVEVAHQRKLVVVLAPLDVREERCLSY